MSTSGSGFNVSGIASGLDWKTMVDQMMGIERNSVVRLQTQKKTLQDKNSAFQGINTKMAALENALKNLTDDDSIKAKKTNLTTPANSNGVSKTVATSTASADAPTGEYTFTVESLATATKVSSAGKGGDNRLGAAITDTGKTLSTLNFAQPVTTGKLHLVLNMTESVEVEVDALTDTLQSLFDKITTATAGRITGSLADNKLTLSADPAITSLSVGTGQDTSNFAAATFLNTANFENNAISSLKGISGTSTGKALSESGIATSEGGTLGSMVGALTINGVEIAYDTDQDSLNNLISRINASKANVIASYDAVNDKLQLTSKSTGATAVAVSDNGAFLQTTGLLDATNQTVGQNAAIRLSNGNEDQTTWLELQSTSNTFTNIAPGLSVSVLAASDTDDDIEHPDNKIATTIKIEADADGVKEKIKSFINEFNSMVDTLDGARAKGQVLAFNGNLSNIRAQLFSTVSRAVEGFSDSPMSMLDLGISTSKADRGHLSLDETKFDAAFAKDPDRVAQIFNKSETVDGETRNHGLAAKLGEYIDNLQSTDGLFKVFDKSTSAQVRALDNSIKNMNIRLTQRQQTLINQFTAMEKMVSSLKSQQSAMTSQLSSL